MQEKETEPVVTKLLKAPYSMETTEKLKSIPLLRDNYGTLLSDFERVYKDVLDQELPLPPEHCGKIKSDLFAAFCRGAMVATDTTSAFRKQFNLPQEVMDEMNKPKIFMPDNEIKTPPPKIIV